MKENFFEKEKPRVFEKEKPRASTFFDPDEYEELLTKGRVTIEEDRNQEGILGHEGDIFYAENKKEKTTYSKTIMIDEVQKTKRKGIVLVTYKLLE